VPLDAVERFRVVVAFRRYRSFFGRGLLWVALALVAIAVLCRTAIGTSARGLRTWLRRFTARGPCAGLSIMRLRLTIAALLIFAYRSRLAVAPLTVSLCPCILVSLSGLFVSLIRAIGSSGLRAPLRVAAKRFLAALLFAVALLLPVRRRRLAVTSLPVTLLLFATLLVTALLLLFALLLLLVVTLLVRLLPSVVARDPVRRWLLGWVGRNNPHEFAFRLGRVRRGRAVVGGDDPILNHVAGAQFVYTGRELIAVGETTRMCTRQQRFVDDRPAGNFASEPHAG
jgi:hypothetical protein